jgi:S1-C subfamily serine protease
MLVTDLHPLSPFAAAGLAPGDVILSLDGQPVASPQEVMYRLAIAGTGRTVALGYWHDGAPATARVTLAAPPRGDRDETTIADDVALRGLTVARTDPALLADLGLPIGAEGIAVLAADDRAARAGLRRGDLILSINGTPVAAPAQVAALAATPTRRWALDILRGGQPVRLLFRF